MVHNPLILITRPYPDALETRSVLEASGYRCIIEPMLTLEIPASPPELLQAELAKPFQAIILTSRNGVRALHQLIPNHPAHWNIVAIGEATATLAKAYGFTNLHTANGSSAQLVEYILEHYTPSRGCLIVLGGTHYTWDSDTTLTSLHYTTVFIPIYEMKASTTLSASTCDALRNKKVDGATFFSSRTADIFLQLVRQHQLLSSLSTVRAFCFSPAIQDRLECHHFASVQHSTAPAMSALCKTISNSFCV